MFLRMRSPRLVRGMVYINLAAVPTLDVHEWPEGSGAYDMRVVLTDQTAFNVRVEGRDATRLLEWLNRNSLEFTMSDKRDYPT